MPLDARRMRNISLFKQAVRDFFWARNYLEVETPLLAPHLIPEAAIEVFKTEFIHPARAPKPLYLVPSPELWMKRMVADSGKDIFQICRCFRNSESLGSIHNPEFTMLEWYTVGAGYMDSLELTETLLVSICRELGLGSTLAFNGKQIDMTPPFTRMSMEDAFNTFLGYGLAGLEDYGTLRERCRQKRIPVAADDSWEHLFHKLFLTCIEPQLPSAKPLFLYDYPAGIPTLAAVKPGTPFAQRWELYLGGIEIANCFTEETDRQKMREFYRGQIKNKQNAIVKHDIDWGLIDYPVRLPHCSGVALGMDRLFMILYNITRIGGLCFFSMYDKVD
jgi:lysyl-tRNA synthetase class 2